MPVGSRRGRRLDPESGVLAHKPMEGHKVGFHPDPGPLWFGVLCQYDNTGSCGVRRISGTRITAPGAQPLVLNRGPGAPSTVTAKPFGAAMATCDSTAKRRPGDVAVTVAEICTPGISNVVDPSLLSPSTRTRSRRLPHPTTCAWPTNPLSTKFVNDTTATVKTAADGMLTANSLPVRAAKIVSAPPELTPTKTSHNSASIVALNEFCAAGHSEA